MKDHSRLHEQSKTSSSETQPIEGPAKVMAPPPFQLGASKEGESTETESPSTSLEAGGGKLYAAENPPLDPNSGDKPSNPNGLPDDLRSGLEALSGLDLADIRVQLNSDKPAQYDAHGYALDKEIHLAPGQEKHLPHEGWHIVQQQQGRVGKTLQRKGISINDNSSLEAEADVMGARAARLGRSGAAPEQRNSSPENSNASRGVAQLLAIQVMTQSDNQNQEGFVISDVLISGRPDRVFSDSMGDHTTAFIVHKAGIQQALQGCDLHTAFGKMAELVMQMKSLPGWALIANLPIGNHKNRLEEALAKLNGFAEISLNAPTAQGNSPANLDQKASGNGNDSKLDVHIPNTGDASQQITQLQNLIETYLEARELIPLSTLNVRQKSASGGKGKGEGNQIEILREYGENPNVSADLARHALIRLFDLSSVACVLLTQNPDQLRTMAPGALPENQQSNANPTALIEQTWQQHLQSVKSNFPAMQTICEEEATVNRLNGNQARNEILTQAMIDLGAAARKCRPHLNTLANGSGEIIDYQNPLSGAMQDAKYDVWAIRNVKGISALRTIYLAKESFEAEVEKVELMESLVFKLQGNDSPQANDDLLSSQLQDEFDGYWVQIQQITGEISMQIETERPRRNSDSKKNPEHKLEASPSRKRKKPFDSVDAKQVSPSGKKPKIVSPDAKHDHKIDLQDQIDSASSSFSNAIMKSTRGTFGVQVKLNAQNEIESLNTDGRPASPFKGSMGAHAIAWTVHEDHVRSCIQGQSIESAINLVQQNVWGLVRKMAQDMPQMGERNPVKPRLDEARSRIDQKVGLINGAQIPQPAVVFLQEFISDILCFTNLIPGITKNKINTDGHGEGSAKTALADYENQLSQILNPSHQSNDEKLDSNTITKRLETHWGSKVNDNLITIKRLINVLFDGNPNSNLFAYHIHMISAIYPNIGLALSLEKLDLSDNS